jgi:hypothetical protein
MDALRSKGVVRRTIEEDGALLVSFLNHDGYFRILDCRKKPALKERIVEAQRRNEEIVFTFDRDLNILAIDGG